ncbi:unnamed protein product [Parnassius apollo]|uniref:(apollo) hypothetical protein n=1 Tax=Parnassius apollo TaxID=110799 RepID=A0A8S3WLR9_PARAO|nr:unnamed protein product [Parnassius apollo]
MKRKGAKEKEDKQAKQDVIKKSRKLDDFIGKPSTDAEDHEKSICSSATPTDSASVSSSASTLVVLASGSKEKAEKVPPILRVQPNPDQRLCKISDDPAKWTIDDFTRDYICKNGANQNIKNDFPKSERIYKHKARHLSKHLFARQFVNSEKFPRKWLIYSKSTGSVFMGPVFFLMAGRVSATKRKVLMTEKYLVIEYQLMRIRLLTNCLSCA